MVDEASPDTRRLEEYFANSRKATQKSIDEDSNWDWLIQNIQFGTQDPDHTWLKTGARRSDKQLELALKDLWWRTIQAAKLFPADDEMRQWRLVAWIAGAKARQPIQDTTSSAHDGKIVWRDLPYFEEALEQAWADRKTLSKYEWHNLNAFVARLVAVTGIDLIYLGLETIRDAIEEPLPTVSTTQRSVSDLLPAAVCWFHYSSTVLQAMTAASERAAKRNQQPPHRKIVSAGDLARAAGVSQEGLSLARQRFWKSRLADVGRASVRGEGGEVTIKLAHEYARKLGTWNFSWPDDLKDVPGWEEPVSYRDNA